MWPNFAGRASVALVGIGGVAACAAPVPAKVAPKPVIVQVSPSALPAALSASAGESSPAVASGAAASAAVAPAPVPDLQPLTPACRGMDLDADQLLATCKLEGDARPFPDTGLALAVADFELFSGSMGTAQYRLTNTSDATLQVDLVHSGYAGFGDLKEVTQGGAVVAPSGCPQVATLTMANWVRLALPPGGAVRMRGDFWANTSQVPPDGYCTPTGQVPGVYRATFELDDVDDSHTLVATASVTVR